MGQKVNPVGFRLGVNRGWDSVWYAKKKDFGNYLIEDFKIKHSLILIVNMNNWEVKIYLKSILTYIVYYYRIGYL